MNIETAAKAAYEACPGQPHKRVPWDVLAEFWRDYWRQIASAVLGVARAGVRAKRGQTAAQEVEDGTK